jgi:hypothetical protein
VKTWDLSTGLCRASFRAPTKGLSRGDAQLIDNRLVFVSCAYEKIHIWDVEKGEHIRTVAAPGGFTRPVRISGDGSKVFCLDQRSIQAWSISTGETVGQVALEYLLWEYSLTVDGSSVWVQSDPSDPCGWDFSIPGSSPVRLSDVPLSRPHLSSTPATPQKNPGQTKIRDIITGKEVLQLPGIFAKPVDAWWDGRYLAAGYRSGEVLIVDFDNILSQ